MALMMGQSASQFMRFAAIGAMGTLVQYGVLWFGVNRLESSPVNASALGYVLGSVVNYLLNYHLTFLSRAPHLGASSRFYVVVGIGWIGNTALMALMVNWLAWNYWLAQVLTTCVGLGWNFTGCKRWVFHHRHNAELTPAAAYEEHDVVQR